MEEFSFDWRNWARSVIGLPVEWQDFYVTNAIVVVLGIVQAAPAPNLAIALLAFAALMPVRLSIRPQRRAALRSVAPPGEPDAAATYDGISVESCAI